MEGRGDVVVLSSNNYLGLCDRPEVVDARAATGSTRFGAGTASVRFICGTFTVHRELEAALAAFVGTPAALTYVSCWNANEGLMPTVLDEADVVISDALNHASIIDSVRLCKAARRVYAHSDMAELEADLATRRAPRARASSSPTACSAWRGTSLACRTSSSWPGDTTRRRGRRRLARHGGARGDRPRHGGALRALRVEVDVITSTLGKALGGAAGGFTAGRAELVDYLIQRSRPQLFSNALPPTVAASALAAVRCVEAHPERVARLRDNAAYFRGQLRERGFAPLAGETPIIPVILGDTARAIRMSELLLDEGVFVTGFGYPVVPQGHARVRCQVSAAHTREDLDRALEAFTRAGRKLGPA